MSYGEEMKENKKCIREERLQDFVRRKDENEKDSNNVMSGESGGLCVMSSGEEMKEN